MQLWVQSICQIKAASALISIGLINTCLLDEVKAQVVGDQTLGRNENTVVIPFNFGNLKIYQIDGGATRGTTLFHSFDQFSFASDSAAFFNNAGSIQNIISRVTGSSKSRIDGIIATNLNSAANLFLINPNGIVFGPNTQLLISGSFLVSTASSINFADGIQFSATTPQTVPMLQVSIPIGLQFGSNPGKIQSQSAILQVPSQKTLALVGGEINIENGALNAPSGRVELLGIGASGTVGFQFANDNFSLSIPNGRSNANVSLINPWLNVTPGIEVFRDNSNINDNSGEIKIQGRSVSLSDTLVTAYTLGEANAGNIFIKAQDSVSLNKSLLTTNVGDSQTDSAMGKVGNISIEARTVSLTNQTQLQAGLSSSTRGTPGVVSLNAQESVTITDLGSGIFTDVGSEAVGDAGDIRISTGTFFLGNGAGLLASNDGQGNSGNIFINSRDSVVLTGNQTGILNSIFEPTSVGDTGNITIQGRSLLFSDGAVITNAHAGQGNTGNISLLAEDHILLSNDVDISTSHAGRGNAGNILLQAKGSISFTQGTSVFTGHQGRGNAGNIFVQTQDTLSLDNLSMITSNVGNNEGITAVGKVGNIEIEAKAVSLTGGAQLQAGLFSGASGDPGYISIKAQESVSFAGIGVFQDGGETILGNSGIFTDVESEAIGNSSDIQISAKSISLTDGGALVTRNRGNGDAGQISLQAKESISITGYSFANNRVVSSGITSAKEAGLGDGGLINIQAENFTAKNGGRVITTTSTSGRAGDITLDITDSTTLSGVTPTFPNQLNEGNPSGLFADTSPNSTGRGGNLTINTRNLQVEDRASVTVSSPQGQAGNLTVNAKIVRLNQGSLTAETAASGGDGANIRLQGLDLLIMQNSSRISAQANGTANGGNIIIDAAEGFVVTAPLQDNDIIASAAEGRGGNIQITTQGVFGIAERASIPGNRSNDIDASSQFGLAGSVTINTPDVDPSRGLLVLATDVIDPNQRVDQSCTAFDRSTGSQFIITGRGGLPHSPNELLSSEMLWSDTRFTRATTKKDDLGNTTAAQSNHSDIKTSIVPAVGWIFNDKGEVTLLSNVSNNTLNKLGSSSIICNQRENT